MTDTQQTKLEGGSLPAGEKVATVLAEEAKAVSKPVTAKKPKEKAAKKVEIYLLLPYNDPLALNSTAIRGYTSLEEALMAQETLAQASRRTTYRLFKTALVEIAPEGE